MGIILIDSKAWEQMYERFIFFMRLLNEKLGENTGADAGKWLDNTDVCEILGVGKRTLQNYRAKGSLPYSQINHKCYYKPEDIRMFIQSQLVESDHPEKK